MCGFWVSYCGDGIFRGRTSFLVKSGTQNFTALTLQHDIICQITPSLGIQLAPALVGSSAWLNLNGGECDTLVMVLFGYGLLQFLILLRLMPWYLSQPFNVSFWGFSFGLSAMAATGLHLAYDGNAVFFIY